MDAYAPATMALPPSPVPRITPASPFSPKERECCQCKSVTVGASASHPDAAVSRTCACSHAFCKQCPRIDARGSPVRRHSFPTDWICSTCGNTHSALEILDGSEVACACGSPTLQAVYDQFGQIYLYWREDESVYDLRDPEKVQEAARRFMLAGGDTWMEDTEGPVDGPAMWKRLS
ncbi:hypothetical protein GQ53DRAFT_33420 [Thozetella sp. PMI_491]|nr:hypothetical protein GQ53DRAFT_33420 [Thozetella sp. PMI_491]